MSAWETNTTLKDIAAFLADKERIVVVTHARPDGDAAGSSLALVRALNRASKTRRASVWFTGGVPAWLDNLAGDAPFHVLEGEKTPDVDADAVVVVDTGSWKQLDHIAEWVRQRSEITSVIDHHLEGNPDVAPRLHIAKTCAAAVQPVCELALEILDLDSPAQLPVSIAELIYTGLATDTGWFRHSNVSPAVFTLAGQLLEAGVNHSKLLATIDQGDRPARLRVMAEALGSLELHDRDRVATMTLTREAIHRAGAGSSDTGGFSELGLKISSVRVSVMLTEVELASEGPATKISLRSKSGPGMIDVNEVAKKLGGGGHANASGARLGLPIDQAKPQVLAAILAYEKEHP
ncbi:MAG: bifunctional oligoribonuclease/PAP phosphatase NrnA [Phycisphaerales bacterium]